MTQNFRRLAASVAVFSIVAGAGAAAASAAEASTKYTHHAVSFNTHAAQKAKSTDEWPV